MKQARTYYDQYDLQTGISLSRFRVMLGEIRGEKVSNKEIWSDLQKNRGDRIICKGMTAKNRQCKNPVMYGEKVCDHHFD